MVLTTHSMEEADILGDQIAIMARGRCGPRQRGGVGWRGCCRRQLGSCGEGSGALLMAASPLLPPSDRRVRAIGSGLRLKQRFGSGYQLSVSVLPPKGLGVGNGDTAAAEAQAAGTAAAKRMFKASLGVG